LAPSAVLAPLPRFEALLGATLVTSAAGGPEGIAHRVGPRER
jgi:hypothetical protein